ncbi:MMPL family transporter [Alienimonas californiensis]|uniref:Membrane protein YdgH n=1 Tax=Alienimonas californiensis TaxID=2527989 RepID=A0A517PAR9_9PLAN|nr:MMPL family transporter [Alienimonas californiensis]QDT16464.1 Putative membrane protein YdgH [Alienimonas californiensis]
MFEVLGRSVTRGWPLVLTVWTLVLAAVWSARPDWNAVTADGEFAFLPEDAPSLAAERQFRERYGTDLLRSSIVLAVSRPARPGGLTGPEDAPADDPDAHDERFLSEVLLPELRETLIAGGFAPSNLPFGDLPPEDPPAEETPQRAPPAPPKPGARLLIEKEEEGAAPTDEFLVAAVLTPRDRVVGPLFESRDGHAALIVLGLRTEFGETRNAPLVTAVEELVRRLRLSGVLPAGLELAVSGTAVVGRDLREATERSGAATHLASLILVIGLLLAIYRAPLLAAVPLITVVVAVEVALSLLALAAGRGWFSPFMGLEVYVTVVAYGAGVDYCMFLTARFREELDAAAAGSLVPAGRGAGGGLRRSKGWSSALGAALAKVGPALAASAGTTVVGIGMMGFAEFGKFQQAALGIVTGLICVTAASLTLAPALLALLGPWAFWPKIPHGKPAAEGGWLPAGSSSSRQRRMRRFWSGLADRVCDRPGRWLLGALAAMAPFAVVGALGQDRLTYGLLSELPENAPGVRGVDAVRRHFPPGEMGPATVLLTSPVRPDGTALDFRDRDADGRGLVDDLTKRLWERREELGLASVRSLSAPLGAGENAPDLTVEGDGGRLAAVLRRAAAAAGVRDYYIAGADAAAGRTVRFDVIFEEDPFTRGSIDRLEGLRDAVHEELPPDLAGADVAVLGATASLADLAAVTARDQTRINALVLLGVYVVLVLLLRRLALSAYLIGTVALGYLTTLGAIIALSHLGAWWVGTPGGFAGLDWKVPTLLFTILVAVGEDYNIYLVTRVDEEHAAARGPGVSESQAAVRGVRTALARTGAIISACGLIMAGTFAAMIFGELTGMVQLGAALAAGVLLDTFVIRPVLVPAYLALLHGGRFGRLGRWLGAASDGSPASTNFPLTNSTPVHYRSTPAEQRRSNAEPLATREPG